MDALTFVCFKDDSQVVDVVARKEYTEEAPETFVRVVPL